MRTTELDIRRAIHEQEERLVGQFGLRVGEHTVREQFRAVMDDLASARIKTFVPVIAFRMAHERLIDLCAREPVAAG